MPSIAHQRHPSHFNRSAQILKTPLCHPCTSESEFHCCQNWILCGKSQFEQATCPLLHRYVEFPTRRCRNMAKPLVDLQQGCNQGPCPELPRVVPGRTTSNAVVLGWYSSPWQQVHLFMLSSKNYLLKRL